MTQLVFIHGPGAGGCADGFRHQLNAFPGSLAPTLPGHLSGAPCESVERYTDWLRGWLWAQSCNRDLVLVGFTLGASIALQYGAPIEKLGDLLTGAKFEPAGPVSGHDRIRHCTSLPDLIGRHLLIEYCGREDLGHVKGATE